ncbi:unnamed protein product [Chrysodeixis includens]|uniref:Uncharacterized protein n=1 Tax=Chrysodeixis includens TaxID=689277 RepID=A0A9N8KNW9_CHRIL|nr:unnamed protein product [Chrysodeixis includens]
MESFYNCIWLHTYFVQCNHIDSVFLSPHSISINVIFLPISHFTWGQRNTIFSSIHPYQTSDCHLLLFHSYHSLYKPSTFYLTFPFLSIHQHSYSSLS